MTVSIAQAQLFLLAFTRIAAALTNVPALGSQTIPNQYRVGMCLLLAIILVPGQPLPPEAAGLNTVNMALAVVRELLLGTLMGFAAALTFAVFQIAAEGMGMGSGFESSHIFNPAMGTSGNVYGQVFVMTATAIFLAASGHHGVLQALRQSFIAAPVASGWMPNSPEAVMQMTAQMIASGIQLSLPVLAALLLADLTLGLLARVAPQMQVYFLGLPLKVGIALIGMSMLLGAGLPILTNLSAQLGQRMLVLMGK